MGIRGRLVGTMFELVSLEEHRSDGTVARPFGDRPAGVFVFGSSGRFSVQLTGQLTGREGDPYLAMFGTYVVDDARATFTLTPLAALDPSLVGAQVLRHVRFADDVAVFSTDPAGDGAVTYITWRPVPAS